MIHDVFQRESAEKRIQQVIWASSSLVYGNNTALSVRED